MSSPPKSPFFDKFDAFVKKLQGVATLQKHPKDKKDADDKPKYASFQDRVLASVVDMGVIYLLLMDVFHFVTLKIYSFIDAAALKAAMQNRPQHAHPLDSITYQLESAYETGLLQLWLLNSFVQSLIVGVILVFIWREFHTTLGKYLLGLKFAGKNGEGEPSFRRYVARFAGFYISMPVFMLGFATLGFDKQKRAWHDRIAGTTVIYSERGHILKQLWRLIRPKR